MTRAKVSFVCVLLKMTFDLISAQLLKPRRCRTCEEGYFVRKNCSVSNGRLWGVMCQLCTNCSAAQRETLLQCSTFADSLCGNKTTPAVTWRPTDAPVSAPDMWSILKVTVPFLFVVLLLGVGITLWSCRSHKWNKLKGLDQL
ncbi:hypothetical protein ABVT39_016305 [Epinephelus coioides]